MDVYTRLELVVVAVLVEGWGRSDIEHDLDGLYRARHGGLQVELQLHEAHSTQLPVPTLALCAPRNRPVSCDFYPDFLLPFPLPSLQPLPASSNSTAGLDQLHIRAIQWPRILSNGTRPSSLSGNLQSTPTKFHLR